MNLIDANLLKAEFTGNFCESYTPAQIKAVIKEMEAEWDEVEARMELDALMRGDENDG